MSVVGGRDVVFSPTQDAMPFPPHSRSLPTTQPYTPARKKSNERKQKREREKTKTKMFSNKLSPMKKHVNITQGTVYERKNTKVASSTSW